jgi:pimeloyl-ACP methyl ester carboxylesterase
VLGRKDAGGVELMARSTVYFDVEEQPASVPIWREALFGFDWLALRISPVRYGCGIPRGDGAPVVVVPGFLGTDFYLLEMHFWLGRIGYRPFLSRIGRNAECLDRLVGRLLGTIEEARASTGRPVHLIGHSLGGMLARAAAVRRPDRIASVITLGSPFRGIRSHPLVMQATSAVRARIRSRAEQGDNRPDCFTAACQCDTVAALQAPLPSAVPQIAIYTKTDGIVDWRSCINDDAEADIEVSGTHVGLAWNPKVYRIIAERLTALAAPARAGAPR